MTITGAGAGASAGAAAGSLKRALVRVCATLAALALFAIMVLTVVDVAGRKLWSASVPGSLELTELLMVVVIFAGLPLVSLHREHVVFDSLDRFVPAPLRRAQHALIDMLCAALLLALAWVMADKARQMASFGDITAQLQLPLAPFVGLMALLCAVTALVHVALALRGDGRAADAPAAAGGAA